MTRGSSGVEAFQLVGPRVEYGTALIASDEAERFRQAALQGIKINALTVDDKETEIQTSAYTSGLLSDASSDYGVYSSAFYAKSVKGADPAYWRSVVSFARFNDKHRHTKIYNTFEVESYEDQVQLAVRRVRVIRSLSRIAFDEAGNPFEDFYSHQRKWYEAAMTSRDVEAVDQRMKRIMLRNRATGGR